MQQKVENDHRYQHMIKHDDMHIARIVEAKWFADKHDWGSLKKLWHAMNQKFHKKQLWWEWRFQKLLRHVLRLQKLLTERNAMIRERDDTIKQLEALLGVQNAIKERESANQQQVSGGSETRN